jgi:hypothetical protein
MDGTFAVLSRRSEFGGVCYDRFAGETNWFLNRFWRNGAAPVLDYRLTRHSTGDLFQDVGDQNSRAAKDRSAVTDARVSHDKTPNSLDFHLLSIANMSSRSNDAAQRRAEVRHQATSATSSLLGRGERDGPHSHRHQVRRGATFGHPLTAARLSSETLRDGGWGQFSASVVRIPGISVQATIVIDLTDGPLTIEATWGHDRRGGGLSMQDDLYADSQRTRVCREAALGQDGSVLTSGATERRLRKGGKVEG